MKKAVFLTMAGLLLSMDNVMAVTHKKNKHQQSVEETPDASAFDISQAKVVQLAENPEGEAEAAKAAPALADKAAEETAENKNREQLAIEAQKQADKA